MPKPRNRKKVLVIGLDSAPPELLFNGFIDDLPMHACMRETRIELRVLCKQH